MQLTPKQEIEYQIIQFLFEKHITIFKSGSTQLTGRDINRERGEELTEELLELFPDITVEWHNSSWKQVQGWLHIYY